MWMWLFRRSGPFTSQELVRLAAFGLSGLPARGFAGAFKVRAALEQKGLVPLGVDWGHGHA